MKLRFYIPVLVLVFLGVNANQQQAHAELPPIFWSEFSRVIDGFFQIGVSPGRFEQLLPVSRYGVRRSEDNWERTGCALPDQVRQLQTIHRPPLHF